MKHQTGEASADLTELLQLRPAGADAWHSVSNDSNAGGEVFGGQYLALAVKAAMLSAPGRMPHMLSAFFLRGARASAPVLYRVERTRDGRGFAHRRVSAWQAGQEAFRAEVSFHEWEAGQPAHATPAPSMPPLAALRSHRQCVLDRADELDPLIVRRVANRVAAEIYFADPEEGLGKPGGSPKSTAWLRPVPPPGDGDAIGYYATLAYVTDACANFAGRIMHAPQLHDGSLASVSLNHAIWFHRPPQRIDRLLYAVESPFAGGGLGFNRGTLFDEEGAVLASVTQEALIRRRPADDHPSQS
ncbi:acyl-CoA thioesterase [Sphingomonas azotifigens]|uniref:acyl-CoA thioesterase n=1 Tax=Sphingomonas azotifigens TaxID=330920 RepID=UPI000A060E6F|nr:acyl-CoA thioesterase domain-containing protein [Sphingomonas azotifigens]